MIKKKFDSLESRFSSIEHELGSIRNENSGLRQQLDMILSILSKESFKK